jgi:hypothetical protein
VKPVDAVKAWSRIQPSEELTERMIAKVQEWAASDEWSDPKYIPYPASWLNGGRWDDGSPMRRTTPNGSLSVVRHGQGSKVGRDGMTDEERGWRENPGHKGWSADEMMRMALAMEQQERERNSA